MMISLIVPTINVYDELILFLNSLTKQSCKDFEVIIVDQNKTLNIKSLIEKYNNRLDIKYIKNDKKGLSLNRNVGLKNAVGKIIAFPDDDCEYDVDTLEKVITFFNTNKDKQIYSCRTLERGKNYGTGVMLSYDTDITFKNVNTTVKSITFFVNFDKDDKIYFDEKLGVGSLFGSGEESDYVLQLLHKGYKGLYFANDIIFHPAKKGNYDDYNRAYSYALGYGALIKKEVIYRKNKIFILEYIKKIFKSFLGIFLTSNREYHFYVLKGRLTGFIKYKR